MNFGFDVGAGLGGVLNAGASILNTISANNWARKNYDIQKLSQDEAMFMNRNQFQVQSSDAQKAGINPLAMQGGSISSASAQNVDAPQMDLSGVNQILGQVLQAKNEKDLQSQFQKWKSDEDAKQRKHDEEMALMRIQSEEKRHSERLSQEQKQFDSNLDEIKRYHEQIKEIENSKLSNEKKRIDIEEKRYLIEQTASDVLNNLREQQSYLNEFELRSRARDLASQLITGYSKNSSGLYGFIERVLSSSAANQIKESHGSSRNKLTPDELAEYLIKGIRSENGRK